MNEMKENKYLKVLEEDFFCRGVAINDGCYSQFLIRPIIWKAYRGVSWKVVLEGRFRSCEMDRMRFFLFTNQTLYARLIVDN